MDEKATKVFCEAKDLLKKYLDANGVNYEPTSDSIHSEKSEDTYHPYGMFLSDCESAEDYFTRYSNMLVINTGILPRGGGINITAALFPLIEEYINEYGDKYLRAMMDAIEESEGKGLSQTKLVDLLRDKLGQI